MTVPTVVVLSGPYSGNGVTTTFAYGGRIFSSADLVVRKRHTASGVVSTLILGADYTVTGVNAGSGGNVVLTTALPSGYTLTIRRTILLTQLTDIKNQGAFFAQIHEDVFDRLTMLIQQLEEKIKRAPTLSEVSSKKDITLPEPEAEMFLRWNAGLTGFDNAVPVGVVVTLSNATPQPIASTPLAGVSSDVSRVDHVHADTGRKAAAVNRNNSGQTILTSEWTKVQFLGVEYDIGDAYDEATNFRWTPGVLGRAHIDACVQYVSVIDTAAYLVAIYKNGVIYKMASRMSAFTGAKVLGANISADVLISNVSDYFEIWTFHDSGVNKDVSGLVSETYANYRMVS